MISPDDAIALLRAVVPLARELGVTSLEMGDLRLSLGPLPATERRPLTEEEAEERAIEAEESRVTYGELAYAGSRRAR